MTTDKLEKLFYEHLPKAFIERVLRSVFMAHAVAWDDCRAAFADTEAQNVIGYYRRGKIEGYLRDAAGLFPGIEATVARSPQSAWNHTEIRSGPVVLTENSVQVPCALVEKAEFRVTLAKSNQLTLWDEVTPAGAPLYALLLHSRSRWEDRQQWLKNGHLPGSAHVAFPARDLESYLHAINLFDVFPHVVDAQVPEEWETETSLAYYARARRVAAA